MKYRKLRIAWSVARGILCLLLISFWVRSYWWVDNLLNDAAIPSRGLVQSFEGALLFERPTDPSRNWNLLGTNWALLSELHPRTNVPPLHKIFRSFGRENSYVVQVPVWLLTLVPAMLAATPWLRWHYSLRTLLIGMTVVAIGLGWIVYAWR